METLKKVAELISKERIDAELIKKSPVSKFELILMANGISVKGGSLSRLSEKPKIGYMVVGYYVQRSKQ